MNALPALGVQQYILAMSAHNRQQTGDEIRRAKSKHEVM
jgi:hypothetical protein